MAKPKAKTLQERMGFTDPDLKTPGHDAIMLWLDDAVKVSFHDWMDVHDWTADEHALLQKRASAWQRYAKRTTDVIEKAQGEMQQYAGHGDGWQKDYFDRAQASKDTAEAALTSGPPPMTLPDFPTLTPSLTKWEHPIITGNSYTVGFIDLMVTYQHPSLTYDEYYNSSEWRAWDYAWEIRQCERRVFFEVKTAIPSLGELMRQLTLYQSHSQYQETITVEGRYGAHAGDRCTPRIFVVCPDARFADKIREQGFGFIQCPGAPTNGHGHAKDDGWLFGRQKL